MKRLFPLLLVFSFAFCNEKIHAQVLPPLQPEQDACNALQLCGNTFFTPYSYQGVGNVFDLTNTPCFGGEINSVWFKLNINTSGTVVFSITPVSPLDDYDFAVANITNTTCNSIQSSNVISCNFNNNNPGSNVNGVVGVSNTGIMPYVQAGAFGNSFCSPINVVAGDVIMIMVNNFGNYSTGGPSSGFTIDFSGSTATFFDNIPPTFNAVATSCNSSQQVTLIMSEPIKCSSLATNGSDFTVSGGGAIASVSGVNCIGPTGYTSNIVVNFTTPLPSGAYSLNSQIGTDGNTLLDFCNNATPVPLSIPFTVLPYVQPAFDIIDTPACNEIKIKLNTKVRCDSIAKNGSDFLISGPQSATINIAYGVGCDTLNFTDTVVLLLSSPLQTDGVYTITAKKGTDGNTMMDSCGLYQAVGNAISMTIDSYDGRIVSPNDSLLCYAVALQLNSMNTVKPPVQSVVCDTTSWACGGIISGAYVGTNALSSLINSPFRASVQDQRSQYLFTATELRLMGLKAGSIRELDLKVTQKSSTTPFNNFTIKMDCSQLNQITGNFTNVSKIVYTNNAYSTVVGWNKFVLNTPINWDGTSNIIVEICYHSSATSPNDLVACSNTNLPTAYQRYGNSLTGCAITNQGTVTTNYYLRPKMRFIICEPPVGILNYAWTPISMVNNSSIANPIAFLNNNTTLFVKTIDKFGCAHRDSTKYVVSVRNPKVRPIDTTVCETTPVQLDASGGTFYTWLTSNPASLSCLICPTPIATVNTSSFYQVIIGDQNNCADTLSSTVHMNPLPFVEIKPEDTIVKYDSKIELQASGAMLYFWYPTNALSNPNVDNPFAIIRDSITIYVTGMDEFGCRNVDSIHIGVDYTDAVFIPSAFSPNGDGHNDVFRIGSVLFEKLQEFRVFNRWGQEVFSANDIDGAWDGTFKGEKQPIGVYNYIIRIGYPNGVTKTYKGDVTLIR